MKIILWAFLFGLSQCGYNWGHQTRKLPGGHRSVYVEMFENQTSEVGLESNFTQALMNELERSGFAIVTSKDQAELILQGNVLNAQVIGGYADPSNFYEKNYTTTDPSQKSKIYTASFFYSYTVTLSANLKAIRSRDKQVIWQTNVNGSKDFQSSRLKRQGVRSSNVLYNQARKKETIKLVTKEMMSDAFDRLTENF